MPIFKSGSVSHMIWCPIGTLRGAYPPFTQFPSLPQSTYFHIPLESTCPFQAWGFTKAWAAVKNHQHNTKMFSFDSSFFFWLPRGLSFWGSRVQGFLWLKSLDNLHLTFSVLLCYLITWTNSVCIPSAPAAFTGRGLWSTPDFAVILDEMSL